MSELFAEVDVILSELRDRFEKQGQELDVTKERCDTLENHNIDLQREVEDFKAAIAEEHP
jgi:hypothetical protein